MPLAEMVVPHSLPSSYAQERNAFGEPLVNFGQIQRHIAESYAEYQAGRAYVYNVANSLDLGSAGNRVETVNMIDCIRIMHAKKRAQLDASES